MRWSPHSTGDRQRFLIVDVADPTLTLNEVDSITSREIDYHRVTRCSKLPNFGAFDWSKTNESIVALGLVSGSASLIQLRDDGKPPETVVTFKTKQQRKCNSVAFSGQDWLAVAVDKTRSDVCLFIYDVNRGPANASEPVGKLCAAELVSSVRFFPSQPQEIVASTQRSFIRLYDLRDGSLGTGGNVQASTRNVNNIAIDPLDENYFASAGSTHDPAVTVWDKRWMSQSPIAGSNNGAVFDFKPAVNNSTKTTVWSLRYSGQCRGRLAVCSSTGELKVIDMVEGRTSLLRSPEYLPANPYGGTYWTSNRYVKETRVLERPWHDQRHGRESKTRIIAYDWAQGEESALEQRVLALRPNREVNVLRVSTAKPMASITPRRDLSLAFEDLSITEPKSYTEQTAPSAPHEQANGVGAAEDFGPLDYAGEDTLDSNEGIGLRCDRDSPWLGRMLALGTVQRERCRRGYLFDCQKNMTIVAGNWQLERLWEIVNRFKEQAADDGMVHGDLDLSFVGVAGLWSEQIGSNPNRRFSPSSAKPEDAIIGLNTTNEIPSFEGERTNFPEHRQFCLVVCGWQFTIDKLEAECQELIDRGLYYQAIVQAVLHGYKHIALNLLRTLIRSKTIQNIGLGALLASNEINDEQREMCLWMAADTEDPALKALLTFLTTGNWRDVMKTNYLHLGYRLALGLKYLNDTELSGFIQSETARAVKNGDLEGILLTGLGEQAMDLFQTYIFRTNDLQTAVLATAFTNPLYVDDVRWEMWKETYFMQMQVWRAFIPRTKFTVQHNRMARTRDGKSLIDPPPAQVTLRCLHCQASLARTDSRYITGQAPTTTVDKDPTAVRVVGPAANAGTVCPRCGRHLPRCGICQLWLGTPRPDSAKELSKADDVMAKLVTFCVSCQHGFHADHARIWFRKHNVCPVPDCRCLCMMK